MNEHEEWHIFLNDKKYTCNIHLPLKDEGSSTLIMGYRAETWDHCERHATNYVYNNHDKKFLFWSPNVEPLGKKMSSNCYLFRTCLVQKRGSLKYAGNTYILSKGKCTLILFSLCRISIH